MHQDPWLSRARLFIGCVTMFVIGTDLFVVSPLLPGISARFGVDAAAAGWMVTVFSVVYMLAAPFLGALSDRWGRRRVMIAGLVIFAFANAATAYAASFTILLASRGLAGLAAAMVSPSMYAITGDAAPPQKRATWLGLVGLGLLIALSVGAPLGSLLSSVWGYAGVFLFIAIASLALAAANGVAYRGASALHAAIATRSKLSLSTRIRAVGPTALWGTAVFGVYTFLGSGLEKVGFSLVEVSGVVAAYGVGTAIGSLSGGKIADRLGAKRTATTAVASLAFTFVLVRVLLGSAHALYAGFFLAGALAQAFFPAQQARLADEFPHQRGAMMAWNNSALYLGIFAGSLLGGQIFVMAGFGALVLTCSAVGFAAALVNNLVAGAPPRPAV